MNELPDLSPKIQVGLFNVLEERDIQIRGFTVRLPLDLCLVFSANPEDYTNRGRIVTPLKDRIGSVIRTHYPLSRELGIRITDENAWTDREETPPVRVPGFMKEIVEETSRLARTSPHINQASGVSVRMSIANYENMVSNAERRVIVQGESVAVARPSDLLHITASSRGKVELAMTEETGEEDRLFIRIVEESIKNIFDQTLSPKQFRSLIEHFEHGSRLTLADSTSTNELLDTFAEIRGFPKQIEQIANDLSPELNVGDTAPGLRAAIGELILDGLYAHNRINKATKTGAAQYGM